MKASEIRALAAHRRRLALRMFQDGCTYAKIGAALGFSRQRAEQLVRKALKLKEKPLPVRARKALQHA